MLDDLNAVADVDAERRWQEWRARGVAADRRSSWFIYRILIAAIAVPAVWGVLQFV